VGKQLSDLTTKRTIMLIFSVIITVPILSYETYFSSQTSYDTGIDMIFKRN